jgi:spermidine dehydrogenase
MSNFGNENAPRSRDHELGMHRNVTRRDFLNGIALGVGGTLASPWLGGLLAAQMPALSAQDCPDYYPPTRTGMRGSPPPVPSKSPRIACLTSIRTTR